MHKARKSTNVLINQHKTTQHLSSCIQHTHTISFCLLLQVYLHKWILAKSWLAPRKLHYMPMFVWIPILLISLELANHCKCRILFSKRSAHCMIAPLIVSRASNSVLWRTRQKHITSKCLRGFKMLQGHSDCLWVVRTVYSCVKFMFKPSLHVFLALSPSYARKCFADADLRWNTVLLTFNDLQYLAMLRDLSFWSTWQAFNFKIPQIWISFFSASSSRRNIQKITEKSRTLRSDIEAGTLLDKLKSLMYAPSESWGSVTKNSCRQTAPLLGEGKGTRYSTTNQQSLSINRCHHPLLF